MKKKSPGKGGTKNNSTSSTLRSLLSLFQKCGSTKGVCMCCAPDKENKRSGRNCTKLTEEVNRDCYNISLCHCCGNCINRNLQGHCCRCGTKFYGEGVKDSKKSDAFLAQNNNSAKSLLPRHKCVSHASCFCDMRNTFSVCKTPHCNTDARQICYSDHLCDLPNFHNTNLATRKRSSSNREYDFENVITRKRSSSNRERSSSNREYDFENITTRKRSSSNREYDFENVTDANMYRVGMKNDETSNSENSRPPSFYEWEIPYMDIEIGELESVTTKGPVYRGRWHGDVMIYTRSHNTHERIINFHEEVVLLGLIRHENVVLFMGACIDPPNLAIVTSVRKGPTLFYHIHVCQSSFHLCSKFMIAKQIAQGMGYLHSKGIALGKLCSRIIFLESKVKIGIADYTMETTPVVKPGYSCIPRGYLTYVSPEVMRRSELSSLYLSWSEKAKESADVFAYGTLLYELNFECYPFGGLHPEAVIWRLGNGKTEALVGSHFPPSFKEIIQSCWTYSESERPTIHDILSIITKVSIPSSLQKSLSISDSGLINDHDMHSDTRYLPDQSFSWKDN